jgi:hypothetical protein
MENFAQQSKENAAVLAARYLENKQSVSAFTRTSENRYIVTFGRGHQEWWNNCSREEILGHRFSRIDEQYWEPSALLCASYYDMVGMADCQPPYYLKTVMGVAGEKATVAVTTRNNPDLWCFAPDFHEAVKALVEQEQSTSMTCGGSRNRRAA